MTHNVFNHLGYVRKIWLIIKKIKNLVVCHGMIWRKNNYGRGGIPNIYIQVSSKLEFMVNILCNIYALTLIRECILMFIGAHLGRDLY